MAYFPLAMTCVATLKGLNRAKTKGENLCIFFLWTRVVSGRPLSKLINSLGRREQCGQQGVPVSSQTGQWGCRPCWTAVFCEGIRETGPDERTGRPFVLT